MLKKLPLLSANAEVGEESKESSKFSKIGGDSTQETSVVSERISTLENKFDTKFKTLNASLRKIQDGIFTKIDNSAEGNLKSTKSYIDKKLISTALTETGSKSNNKLFSELTDTLNTLTGKLDTLAIAGAEGENKSDVFDLGKSLPDELERLNKNIDSLNKLFKDDSEKEKDAKNNPILGFLGGIFGEAGSFAKLLGAGGAIALAITGGLLIKKFLNSNSWIEIRNSEAFKPIIDRLEAIGKKLGVSILETAGEAGVNIKERIQKVAPLINAPVLASVGVGILHGGGVLSATGVGAGVGVPAMLAGGAMIGGALLFSHLAGVGAENRNGGGSGSYYRGMASEWTGNFLDFNDIHKRGGVINAFGRQLDNIQEKWNKESKPDPATVKVNSEIAAALKKYKKKPGVPQDQVDFSPQQKEEWRIIVEKIMQNRTKAATPKIEATQKTIQDSKKLAPAKPAAQAPAPPQATNSENGAQAQSTNGQITNVTNINNSKTIVDYLPPGVDGDRYSWHYDGIYSRKYNNGSYS